MSVDTFGQEVRTWVETGLTATGSMQADAFPLMGNTQNEFTTVGSGTGCILPMAYPSPPSQISVFNAGSNALAVYPPLGGTINDGTVNAPYSLAAGTGLTYWASSLSNWYSVQTSGSGTVNSGTASNLAYYGATGTAVSGATRFGYDAMNTCPIWTPITAPGSPFQGDQWFDSVAGGIVTCRFVDGSGNALNTMDDGTFFKCTTCAALSSSATQATLLGSPATSWGSLTIPSGALKANQIIELDFLGLTSDTGTPTFAFSVFFGGKQILVASAAGQGNGWSNAVSRSLGPIGIFIRTVGASGTINGFGYIMTGTPPTETASILVTTAGTSGPDLTGINYNQANTIDFRGQWSAASASNTAQILGFSARLKG